MTVNNISPKSPFSDFEKTRTQRQRPTKPVEVKQNQPLPQNPDERTQKEEKNNLMKKAKKLFQTKKTKIITAQKKNKKTQIKSKTNKKILSKIFF